MDIKKLIGMSGGTDQTYFQILEEQSLGEKSVFPSIKDGKKLSILDVGSAEYFAHKVERKVFAVQFLVMGNPIAAEHALTRQGIRALAIAPHILEVYPNAGMTMRVHVIKNP